VMRLIWVLFWGAPRPPSVVHPRASPQGGVEGGGGGCLSPKKKNPGVLGGGGERPTPPPPPRHYNRVSHGSGRRDSQRPRRGGRRKSRTGYACIQVASVREKAIDRDPAELTGG